MAWLRVCGLVGVLSSLCACHQWQNPAWLDYDLNDKISQIFRYTKPVTTHVAQVVDYQQDLPAFNAVNIKGPFNLRVIQHAKKTGVKFTGQQRYVNQVMATVSGDVLDIQYASDQSDPADPVQIILYTPNLHKLAFHHPTGADVNLAHFKSALLDLNIHNGYLTLDGKVGVRHIIATGQSRLHLKGVHSESMTVALKNQARVVVEGFTRIEEINACDEGFLQAHWLDSRDLRIRLSDLARVKLAGMAKVYDARVQDTAHLDARYLRAHTAYVKTFNKAVADIHVIRNQNTLANDTSNIYFHQPAKAHGDFMAHQGTAMDFSDIDRWINDPRFGFPAS